MVRAEIQLKIDLYEVCKARVNGQIQLLNQQLKSVQESRNNETKSSVGDKYETGRAMMQLEEEQINAQLLRVHNSRNVLGQIDPQKITESIRPGSLVITDQGKYFISIGLGKVKLGKDTFYCISMDSPIGKQLGNRVEKDEIKFNGRPILIEQIF